MIPQTKDKDYNPYKYSREDYILSCLFVSISYGITDYCEDGKKLIEKFDEVGLKASDKEKCKYISDISLYQCQEAYDFLVTQIKNSPSEAVRCDAIKALAWNLNTDYLPTILEYGKKESLSIQEKLALADAYTVYGIYLSNPDLKEKAIKLLDEVCYDSSPFSDLEDNCIWTYYKLGGKPAISYHISLLEQNELRRNVAVAAYGLVPLGEYEISYPILVEAIHSEDPHIILCAIDGLRVIGTEEALRLIEEQSHSKNERIVKKIQETFKNLDMERGKE